VCVLLISLCVYSFTYVSEWTVESIKFMFLLTVYANYASTHPIDEARGIMFLGCLLICAYMLTEAFSDQLATNF